MENLGHSAYSLHVCTRQIKLSSLRSPKNTQNISINKLAKKTELDPRPMAQKMTLFTNAFRDESISRHRIELCKSIVLQTEVVCSLGFPGSNRAPFYSRRIGSVARSTSSAADAAIFVVVRVFNCFHVDGCETTLLEDEAQRPRKLPKPKLQKTTTKTLPSHEPAQSLKTPQNSRTEHQKHTGRCPDRLRPPLLLLLWCYHWSCPPPVCKENNNYCHQYCT